MKRIFPGAPSTVIAIALLVLAGLALKSYPAAAESARALPMPAVDQPPGQATSAVVVLAGGCFWGVQGVFQHVKGVTNAVSGYAGGDRKSADYEAVSSGRTGHAESVQVTYDPRQISYGRVLQIFFSVAHDPTQLNRQGPDTGTQYRSDFPAQRRPGRDRQGLHRAARSGKGVQESDRHQGRTRPQLLSGGELPSGFSDP
jgi:peptide-methionine (S)-S-oxide reductase